MPSSTAWDYRLTSSPCAPQACVPVGSGLGAAACFQDLAGEQPDLPGGLPATAAFRLSGISADSAASACSEGGR